MYVNSLFSLQTTVRQVGGSPPYYCTVSELGLAALCRSQVLGLWRGQGRACAVRRVQQDCPMCSCGLCSKVEARWAAAMRVGGCPLSAYSCN